MPVKWDLSMTLSPAKSLSVSSAEEFLSEIEPSIMWPRNLIGPEWIEGIEDETSCWSIKKKKKKKKLRHEIFCKLYIYP